MGRSPGLGRGLVQIFVAVLLLAGVGESNKGAEATPVTFSYQGQVTSVLSFPGVNVGDLITGSFTFDPTLPFTSWSFSASVGSFSLTEPFSFFLQNGSPDEQFIEGTGPQQFGFFFSNFDGTALSGTTLSDLNFNLTAWDIEQVRYGVSGPPSFIITNSWTGTLTEISAVPEPSTLLLLASAAVGLGARVCRRRGRE